MNENQNIDSIAKTVTDLLSSVMDDYADFVKVAENSNKIRTAISSASSPTTLYTNLKSLATSQQLKIVQEYEYIDTLDGTFQILLNDTPLKWDANIGRVRLNTGVAISFGVLDGPSVYKSTAGRVALFDRTTRLALRHVNGGSVSLSKFIPNNWDFSWMITKTASGKYEIQNDFWRGAETCTLCYNPSNDQFNMKVIWDGSRDKLTFGEGMPSQYLSPNKSGLYLRWMQGYFADNLAYVTNTNSVNNPFIEMVVEDVRDIFPASGYFRAPNGVEPLTFVHTGYFFAPVSGMYTLALNSDDASYLWFGANALSGFTVGNSDINNGGYHGMVKKSITKSLVAGTYYPILIIYGQAGGYANLIFSWTPPNRSETVNGKGYLFLNPAN